MQTLCAIHAQSLPPPTSKLFYQIKIPSSFPSLSWSNNATSKMGKSDTKPLRLFSSKCSPLQSTWSSKTRAQKWTLKPKKKSDLGFFCCGHKSKNLSNSGPITRKIVFSIKKSKTNQKKKQSYRAFARKILNLVDLPNQIWFKILVTLFFFHVWPIS